MKKNKRTATCGQLTAADIGKKVTLNGWVHRLRNHGGLLFINLRDRYGVTQTVVDQHESDPELLLIVDELKPEYCVAITGVVSGRPPEMINSEMATGEIELTIDNVEILSTSRTPPFVIGEKSEAKEELRLKYRYLDLRSAQMQRRIQARHKVCRVIRRFLNNEGFLEIETPTFIRSTPEGARDFLVPSRLLPGKFYALPQSPQLFKQLLMVSGMDKYYQIARCYRDEDFRGNRQPEFTQLDLEMSFIDQQDIFDLSERLMVDIFNELDITPPPTPFVAFSYDEAMNRYGSDKPDIRFGLELIELSSLFADSPLKFMAQAVAAGGVVKALTVPGGSAFSRKEIDELEQCARRYGAGGLAWCKVGDEELTGGIGRHAQPVREALMAACSAKSGDLLLFVADKWLKCVTALGAVRLTVGKKLQLVKADQFAFCWVKEFPLFEWDEENRKIVAAHHLFTMPFEQHIDLLESEPLAVKARQYDLVLNGEELGSGSIRIHDQDIQKKVFKAAGISEQEAERRFGFLLEAFRYGPPPHGGIAPGLDRLVMLLVGDTDIRQVIAFPKTGSGVSLLDDSPAEVDSRQLDELSLRVVKQD